MNMSNFSGDFCRIWEGCDKNQEDKKIARYLLIAGVVVLIFGHNCSAQENLVANPDFEEIGENDFFAHWGSTYSGQIGSVTFVEKKGAHSGKNCLRMTGTPGAFTTCGARDIEVVPETNYWVTWWFKGKQPVTSRTYLFLQTNFAQRVFPLTDKRGDFDWTFNIVRYQPLPGERTISPVLTMHAPTGEPGTSWWDEIGVWEKLPPEIEAIYRRDHPWDDVKITTAQVFKMTSSCMIWGDRPEVRIYPNNSMPENAGIAKDILLTAPGNGHDVYQLIVSPVQEIDSLSLQFSQPTGPGNMPTSSLSYKILRCVPVKEVRDKSFPLGPTPDPLMEPIKSETARPDENVIFWIEWSPPANSEPGVYRTEVTVLSDKKSIASIPLRLRRWAFNLPQISHYRSMVLISVSYIRQFYPGISEDQAYRLAWDILSQHRLSGFNLALWPTPNLKDGKMEIDWARFDRILAAAKEYKATALTLGPMFGGGCGEGWKPRLKFLGFTPLADEGFNAPYIEFNRQIAERLRQQGMFDKAYVYPYDEPEPDYMDKIANLCDLIHQSDPKFKCLMTVDPNISKSLYGKVNAWIIPSSVLSPDIIEERRAAGDEIWIYNMTAAIEDAPLAHRLYMWKALRVDAIGGLLWNSCWWNKINPWEDPTAAPYPVGRKSESLYRYQAGQASLFYPDPAGKGPLIPALRLVLIRQGVEDFDILTELVMAWEKGLQHLSAKAKSENLTAKTRMNFISPVLLDLMTPTTSPARAEAVRLIAGNELEVANQRPIVIASPVRIKGKLALAGYAEVGTQLTLNGKPTILDGDGRFEVLLSEEQLGAGLQWEAKKENFSKKWGWAGLK